MRKIAGTGYVRGTQRLSALCLILLCVFLPLAAQNPVGAKPAALADSPPYWAYAVDLPAGSTASPKTDDATPHHVPASDAAFTHAQVHNLFSAPDWHPTSHPTMPEIVSRGRAPDVFACGFCHLPNGQGRPENSSLAGLPAAYIVQQLADFKSGLRKSSEPKHGPTRAMIAFETKANDKEIKAAAEYFSAIRPEPWIRVVETNTVPKTHVAGWMLVASDPSATEPIAQRIIETPEILEQTELRDDHSGFVAYVPVGSIQKGEALVKTGAGKRAACSTCHGPGLKGLGKVPRLAGRSPSYIVRQLYDMKSGARVGIAAQKMRPVVARLTLDDMTAIAAYVASLSP